MRRRVTVMRSWGMAVAACVAFATAALNLAPGGGRSASAWQGLMSEPQLKEKSQLVVIADVLGVACIGLRGEDRPRYRAWLQVVETDKGKVERHATLQVGWTAVDYNRVGSWEPKIYPGARARFYLVAAEDPGTWEVVHPDGVVDVRPVPREARVLPKAPGEVIFRRPTAADLKAPEPPTDNRIAPEGRERPADPSREKPATTPNGAAGKESDPAPKESAG